MAGNYRPEVDPKTTTPPVDAAITRRLATLTHTSQRQGIIDPKWTQSGPENDDTTGGRSHYKAFSHPDTHFPTAGNYRPKVDPKTTTPPVDAAITRRLATLTHTSQRQGIIDPKWTRKR